MTERQTEQTLASRADARAVDTALELVTLGEANTSAKTTPSAPTVAHPHRRDARSSSYNPEAHRDGAAPATGLHRRRFIARRAAPRFIARRASAAPDSPRPPAIWSGRTDRTAGAAKLKSRHPSANPTLNSRLAALKRPPGPADRRGNADQGRALPTLCRCFAAPAETAGHEEHQDRPHRCSPHGPGAPPDHRRGSRHLDLESQHLRTQRRPPDGRPSAFEQLPRGDYGWVVDSV